MAAKPLCNRIILVTRARSQAGVFTEMLRAHGAQVIEVPTIGIRPRPEEELDRSFMDLEHYNWILFTSVNTVDVFFNWLKGSQAGRLNCKICAIGPATAQGIKARGYPVDLQPKLYQAEGILEGFSKLYTGRLSGLRILLPRAAAARELLPAELTRRGATVDVVPVYDTVIPEESRGALIDLLSKVKPDLVTFTSSSTVRNFATMAGPDVNLSGLQCGAIGPITAATALDYGIPVVVQPKDSTIPAFVEAIRDHFG